MQIGPSFADTLRVGCGGGVHDLCLCHSERPRLSWYVALQRHRLKNNRYTYNKAPGTTVLAVSIVLVFLPAIATEVPDHKSDRLLPSA